MDIYWWYQCCRCGNREKIALYDDRPGMNAGLERGHICERCNGRGPFKKDGRALSDDETSPILLLIDATLEEIDAIEPWPTEDAFGEPEVRSSDVAFRFKDQARKTLFAMCRDRESVLHQGKPSAVREVLADMEIFKGYCGYARFIGPNWSEAMTSPPRRVLPENVGLYPRVVLIPVAILDKYSSGSPFSSSPVWLIHCWNATAKHWHIETEPAFRQVLASVEESELSRASHWHYCSPDVYPLPAEVEREILTFGPKGVMAELKPGVMVQVGDVLGWEVESQLEFTLRATDRETGQTIVQRLDLGDRWTGWVDLPRVGEGGVVTPLEVQKVMNTQAHITSFLSRFRWGIKAVFGRWINGAERGVVSTAKLTATSHTYLVDDPGAEYMCMFCRRPIGPRSAVQFVEQDGVSYVYCCTEHVGRRRVSRRGDAPDDLYDCSMCGKFIGTSENIQGFDKHGRVYCSSKCDSDAFSHPSRDWDDRDSY
ncbi:MAG: hypothetical protein HQL80_08020 [Magnetococcales bacterium]|nr:hypothetical protein [Magnetococcales bacterium]